MDEGCKYVAKHPQLGKAKTRLLLTLGAKGNLLLSEKAQITDKQIDEAYQQMSKSVYNKQKWLVDLGVTSHIIPDCIAFIKYTILSIGQPIIAQAGEKYAISRINMVLMPEL